MINNRKLGIAEQTMEILNHRAKTWNIVTISRIKGPLKEEIVRKALTFVQGRYPVLNSQIVGSLNNLRFKTKEIPEIPLRVVEVLHNTQWQEVVEEELNEKIDAKENLLRIVLITTSNSNKNSVSHLITTIHHAVSDGLSCISLHSEILTYCQKIESLDTIFPVASLPILPPIEALLPASTRGFRGAISNALFLLRLFWFQKIWKRPETLAFEKYSTIASRRCGMIHRQLDEELTKQFVSLCKQEKTTVQGALCAAMMFAVVRKITVGERRDVYVACQSYVDLRRRLETTISDEQIALISSSVWGFHTIKTSTSFWELARDMKQQMEAGMKRKDIFNAVLMSKKLTEYCFTHSHEVAATVSISNLGKVNIPKVYGQFELEEISFTVSNFLFVGTFAMDAVTFEGKMFINFPFAEPSISRATTETLVNSVVSCIVEVCQEVEKEVVH